MANKQTTAYKKLRISTKVIKGAAVPKDSDPLRKDSHIGVCLSYQQFDAPAAKPRARTGEAGSKKPWKGCGDPLGRNRK